MNKSETSYCVVTAENPVQMAQRVEQLIQNGWVLQGGVSLAMIRYGDDVIYERYAQAMTKNYETP